MQIFSNQGPLYEDKVKSSRPCLQPTWNSGGAAVGYGPGQELVSPSLYEYDKAFLVADQGSMSIEGRRRARWKVFGLPYNRREIRDKRPLGRNTDRSCCQRHTTSIIKLFGRRPWLHGHRRQHTDKVKVLGPVYNRRETQDKRPLDRDPDRSWCHRHISVNLYWSQPHRSMDVSGSTLVCCHRCPWSHGQWPNIFKLVWQCD